MARGLFIPSILDMTGFRRGARDAKQEGKKAGQQTALEFLKGQQEEYRKGRSAIKEAQQRGLLTTADARQRGREVGKAFNDAILARLDEMRRAGQQNTAEFERLQRSLKNVSSAGGRAARETSRGFKGVLGTISQVRLAVGAVVAALGIRRGISFLRDTGREAEELVKSYLRASSAAKLFGVAETEIASLSAKARTEFKLSAKDSNDLAVNITKLAARAGEAARSQEILAAALDLGAAQGLDAVQVGIALEQTLRGLDEGTDKLFQKNPSQIYAEFAAGIGKTANSLSDVEQKQALVNAVLTEGGKVAGEYNRILATNIGDLQTWRQRLQAAREEIGARVIPISARLATVLSGPLSTAVRGLNSLLESFLSPAERMVLALERMGAASELALPSILRERIEQSQDRLEGLRKELASINREFRGGLLITSPGQPGGGAGPGLPQSELEIIRAQAEAQRELDRAQAEGDKRAQSRATERLKILTRALEVTRQIKAEETAQQQTRLGLGEAERRAATASQLESVKARIAELVAESAERGESVATEATLRALEAQKERLEKELGRIVDTVTPTGGEGEEDATAKQIEAARERLEELVAVQRESARVGLTGIALPETVTARLQEVVKLQATIRQAEKDSALLGGNVPPETAQVLDQLRDRVAQLEGSLRGLVADTDVIPEIGRSLALAFSPELLKRFEAGLAPVTVGLRTLEASVREAEAAEASLTAARLTGDPARIAQAEGRLADARGRVVSITRALAQALSDAGLSNDVVTAILAAIEKALRDAGIQMDELTGKSGDFAATLGAVETAGRGLIGIADNMGLIDDQTRRAATGVLDLVAGLQQVKASQGLSGLAGALGTLSGVGAVLGGIVGIASLFGGSDQEKRIEEIDRNTEAIRDLGDRIEGLLSEIGPFESAVLAAVDAAEEVTRRVIESLTGFRLSADVSTVPAARERLLGARARVEEELRTAEPGERRALQNQLTEIDDAIAALDAFFERLRRQAEQDLATGLALAEGRTGDAAALELQFEREAKLRDLQAAGLDDLIPKYEELFALQDAAAARQFEHEEAVELLRVQGFDATAAALERQKQREEELAAARSDAERATIAARHAEEDLALRREARQELDELLVSAFGTDAQVEAFRAQQQMNDAILHYTDLLNAGLISQAEFGEAMEAIGVIFDRTLKEIQDRIRDQGLSFAAEQEAIAAEQAGDQQKAEEIRFRDQQRQDRERAQDLFDQGVITQEQFEQFLKNQETALDRFLAGTTDSGTRRAANAGRLERDSETVAQALRGATHADFVTASDILRSSLLVHRDALARLVSIDGKLGGFQPGASAAHLPPPAGGGNSISQTSQISISGLSVVVQTPAISTANARYVGDQISDAMVDGLERRLGQRFGRAQGNAGRLER